MKSLFLIALLFASNAFAITKKCSNADGTIRFDLWTYEGGAMPPEGTPLWVAKYIVNGKEEPESAGNIDVLEILSREENEYVVITKELVQIQVASQTANHIDFAICTTKIPKIAMPNP